MAGGEKEAMNAVNSNGYDDRGREISHAHYNTPFPVLFIYLKKLLNLFMADMRFRIVVYFFLRVFKGKEELLWEGDRSSNPSTRKTDFYLYRRKNVLPPPEWCFSITGCCDNGRRRSKGMKGFLTNPFYIHRLLGKGETATQKCGWRGRGLINPLSDSGIFGGWQKRGGRRREFWVKTFLTLWSE